MKRVLTTLLLTFLAYFTLHGQEFSFPIYFEDSRGNRDTIIIGYDTNGSREIEEEFGEVNIIDSAYNSEFEVRAAIYNYDLIDCLDNSDPRILESKKMIVKNICLNTDYFDEAESIMAVIKCKNPPFTVSWDSLVFSDTCKWVKIVDWKPGGWFDACCCNGASIVSYMHELSSYSFDNTDYIITTEQDTFYTLFFPFEDKVVGLNNGLSQNSIKVFPNPTTDYLIFEGIDNYYELVIRFYGINGQEVLSTDINSNRIELSKLGKGFFIYEILDSKRIVQIGKLFIN